MYQENCDLKTEIKVEDEEFEKTIRYEKYLNVCDDALRRKFKM